LAGWKPSASSGQLSLALGYRSLCSLHGRYAAIKEEPSLRWVRFLPLKPCSKMEQGTGTELNFLLAKVELQIANKKASSKADLDNEKKRKDQYHS
jgi:hypothetical protein